MHDFDEKFAKAKAVADKTLGGGNQRTDEAIAILLLMILESLEDSRDQLYRIEQELQIIKGHQ